MDATFNRTDSDCARQPFARASVFIAVLVAVAMQAGVSQAANFRTRNFLVEAHTPQLAREVGDAAERFRDELATYWTGSPLPPWPTPCPVRVVAGDNLAAQGVTTYNPAPVRDFQMEVIGTPERILDSVLPHEVTHTVLATYFGRPLPRWADEGICTTVEHASERAKHETKLREFLASRRGIAMNRLFLLTEYPQDVLPMYAQGYSVCRFLIEQQGPRTFVGFLKDYMQRPSWTANVQKHYGYDSLAELQEYWLAWVEAGSGSVEKFVKADVRPASSPAASVASLQSPANASPSDRDGRIAPASAMLASSDILHERTEGLENNLVAANDRGRLAESTAGGSWYHRRASGVNASSETERPLTSPTSGQLADALTGRPLEANRTQEPATPRWAPPSVVSSGRYSSATPQAESMGSVRSNSAMLDAPVPRGNANDRRFQQQEPQPSMWR